MTPEVEKTLPGRSVTQVRFAKPDFVATTPGKAMFGVLGAVAMIAAGNDIVTTNKIEDPASSIAQSLTRGMQEKFQLVPLNETATQVDTSDVDTLARSYPKSDLLLDVRTTDWKFVYFPVNWTHYRVGYSVQARLVNLKTREVLAEGTCKHLPEEDTNAPTEDELLANNASRLKQELRNAADHCLEQLKKTIFRL
jgi:hypothetical protein